MEKHSVDVVLTDYRMPKMDGFEFLSVCRVKWPGIPVVVFSAEQDDLAHEAVERERLRGFAKEVNSRYSWNSLPMRFNNQFMHERNACRNLAWVKRNPSTGFSKSRARKKPRCHEPQRPSERPFTLFFGSNLGRIAPHGLQSMDETMLTQPGWLVHNRAGGARNLMAFT